MNFPKVLFSSIVICLSLLVFAEDRDGSYNFIVLGDVHYTPISAYPNLSVHPQRRRVQEYNRMWDKNTPELLRAASRAALDHKAKFAVQLGDLTHGDCPTGQLHEQVFRPAFNILKNCFPKIPLYVLVGNHDINQSNGVGAEPVRKALLPLVGNELGIKNLSSGNYSFRIGEDLFIAIDCFTGDEYCQDFIRQVLYENPDTRYVFLLTHLPMFQACGQRKMQSVPGYYRIIQMLETRRTVILGAHTHEFSLTTLTTRKGRLPQLIVTSMGNEWRNNPWLRRIFGTRLEIVDTWEKYLPKIKKKIAEKQNAAARLEELDALLAMGSFEGQNYGMRSGFVILRVSDRRVQADIYVDDGEKPALTLDLR